MKAVKRRSRAWPVDPARYPLSGPTQGRVYTPPPEVVIGQEGPLSRFAGLVFTIAIAVFVLMTALSVFRHTRALWE